MATRNQIIDRINNREKTSESGFTIVELLITLVVGAVLVTGINSIVVSQSFLAQRSRDLIIANAFVEAKVEELRSLGFSGLSNGTTVITGQLPTELSTPRSASQVITSYSGAIKKVVYTINYNEQGASRTYSYSTFIGELGVGQY